MPKQTWFALCWLGACTIPAREIPAVDEPGRSDLSSVVRWEVTGDADLLRFEGLNADDALEFSLTIRNVTGAGGAAQSAFDIYDVTAGGGSLVLDAEGTITEDSVPLDEAIGGDLLALAIDTHAALEHGGPLDEYPAASGRLCLPTPLRAVLPSTCGELDAHRHRAKVVAIGSWLAVLAAGFIDWNAGGWILTLVGTASGSVSTGYFLVMLVRQYTTDCLRKPAQTPISWPYCDGGR